VSSAQLATARKTLDMDSTASVSIPASSEIEVALPEKPLAALAMRSSVPGFFRAVFAVAKFEAKNLRSQPGLYLFIPLIVLQAVENGYFRTGPFDTRLLLTSGMFAALSMNTLTLLVCLLILFYTVESLLRERGTGVAPIIYSTPVQGGALLFGKAIANSIVGAVVLAAAFLGGAGVMVAQGKVSIEIGPFLSIWGLLLIPTFLVWSSFVMAVLSLVRDRYVTYAIGLGVLILCGFLQLWGKMNWVWNWDLWSAITWTDFGSIEPNGFPVTLNRLFYLSLAALFLAIAVRLFPRRELDAARAVDRLRPKPLLLGLLRMSPFWVPPLALGIFLGVQVQQGFQGKAVENRERNYWKKNILTWLDARQPYLAGADIDVTVDPDQGHFAVVGSYDLFHDEDRPMESFALSVGDHFDSLTWTLDGAALEPEDRERLFVFHMDPPLAAYDTIRVGFSHEGRIPDGATKNGGGLGEFIVPSGVVLTSFSNCFLPTVGFSGERGVDPKHPLEAKVFSKDFYLGKTRPAFGSQRPYPVRTRISGPDDLEYHGVGVKVEETVGDGQRTVVWESDEPVNFFNVVGAKWSVWHGDGTAIYYYPKHDYNLEEMGVALDAARKYFSEWFYPFPWRELRLNEFPALATYAQGFPSNITFSESIGFLTRSSREVDMAFMVTAHEAAHQWWGNLLLPGEGPGGNILSEGMAHFSTILLFEQIHGVRGRIEFCKRIEERYGDNRQVDSERQLVLVDGSRPGDTTVTYDKGGWVFWMLHDFMGPDSSLAGIQKFMRTYHVSDDHPVLQDYVATLRPYAPDSTAYDAFVKQWFHEVVVPEFSFTDVEKVQENGTWIVTGKVENKGTGRVPVEIAATRGERFPKEEADEAASSNTVDRPGEGVRSTDELASREDSLSSAKDEDGYREERTTLVLGPGEIQSVRLECIFEPERILADPDARVLQLRRDGAVEEL
jgi:ABC-2 type transport system permease protein